MLDERLQKLEKQRQNLEAKIQREAQNKEIKAQKQAKAKEEKQRKERQAQENRQAKQAQKRELREAKRQQREFYKDESTALSDDTNSQESYSKRLTRTQFYTTQNYTNPNDRNGWFIALVPTVDVMFLYSDARSNAVSYLYRFGAEYGATLEAGYLFGSGANRWRTYFSLGYGYGRSSDESYRYGYYNSYDTEVIVDIHNITHNAGIDWIPRLGNSSARGVLGFYNNFSYMIMRDRYDLFYETWNDTYFLPYGYSRNYQTIHLGQRQDFIHIFFIGIGTRFGVIFDIKEHFSIEIGSRLSLHFSILGANGSGGGLQFIQSVMPRFQQYLSFAYRF